MNARFRLRDWPPADPTHPKPQFPADHRARPGSLQHGLQCALLWLLPALASAQPNVVNVTAVRVEGNTLLPEKTLTALTSEIAGAQPGLAELNALAARIQHAYRVAGYGGVVAYVPAQEASGGQVVVRVVEGKIAAVKVSGNAHFSTANVRSGLPNLREGTTPHVREINRDIQLSNDNPAKHLNVSLTAGKEPGAIDAEVSVSDARPVQYLAGYNNSGTPVTGRHRLSVGIEHANLFGRDHVGTLQFQTSPGYPERVKIFSAGYRVPLYAHAASFDAFVAHSTVSNGTTATTAGPLSFSGKGTILGLRANRHLDRIGEYDHHVTLALDRRAYDDDCSLGDFGAAGCGSAAVDVTTVPVSLSYTGQQGDPELQFGLSVSLSTNAAGSSQRTFEAARPGAKRAYVLSRLSGFVEKRLPAGRALTVRAEMQYSAHALITPEKFGIGGASSVRGYAERELSGDSGAVLRIELSGASFDWEQAARLRPYLFLDHGRVSNRGAMPCNGADGAKCELTGAGLGLRMNVQKRATASVDIGRALERGPSTARGDLRGHAALNVVF